MEVSKSLVDREFIIINVGANTSHSGLVSPLWENGTFCFMPIPEEGTSPDPNRDLFSCCPNLPTFKDFVKPQIAFCVHEKYLTKKVHDDPEFETFAVPDIFCAVGIVFIFAIPLIVSMNFPVYGYTTGNSLYYWLTFGVYMSGLVFVFVVSLLCILGMPSPSSQCSPGQPIFHITAANPTTTELSRTSVQACKGRAASPYTCRAVPGCGAEISFRTDKEKGYSGPQRIC